MRKSWKHNVIPPTCNWRALLGGLTLLLGSCTVGQPVPEPAAPKLPARFAGANSASADTASAGALPWPNFFADPVLVRLLDTAVQYNPDLAQAAQRVALAQTDVLERRGALLPTVEVGARAGVDRYGTYTQNGVGNYDTNLSPNTRGDRRIPSSVPDYFLGLRSSWEIDLWGRLRNRRKAAQVRLLGSEFGRQLVQTTLVAEVARTYYEVLALDQELEILRRNARLQERTIEISRIQKQGGRATELAVQQFTAQWRRTQSLEAAAQQQLITAENRLNRLLGRYPQPISRGQGLLAQPVPAAIQVGVPTALLFHRPDIRQAEAELTAARADVEAARAAFLPSLTLTSYAGVNAFRTSLLLRTPESLALGALAGLTAPLFNRAYLKAEYGRATARQLEAYYGYQQATQRSVEEVATTLQGVGNLGRAFELRSQEVAVLNAAVATSNELFLAGYATYLEVVTAQRNVLEAELDQIAARRAQFTHVVDLYRALGGGWRLADRR